MVVGPVVADAVGGDGQEAGLPEIGGGGEFAECVGVAGFAEHGTAEGRAAGPAEAGGGRQQFQVHGLAVRTAIVPGGVAPHEHEDGLTFVDIHHEVVEAFVGRGLHSSISRVIPVGAGVSDAAEMFVF